MTDLSEALTDLQAALTKLQAASTALDEVTSVLESLPEYKAFERARDIHREAGILAEAARDNLISVLSNSYF